MRRSTFVVLLLVSEAVAQGNWKLVVPSTSPLERKTPGMCYDTDRARVVLYGGNQRSTGGPLSDTWELSNGTVWQKSATTTAPSARYEVGMVYDAARRQTVLFGGKGSSGQLMNETWIWNGVDWKRLQTATAPDGRVGHAMTFDSHRGKVIMFGGAKTGSQLNDTWEWDGKIWGDVSPSNPPSTRRDHLMVYDPVRRVVVLFGGNDGQSQSDETWEYDGLLKKWAKRTPKTTTPPARQGHGMAFNLARGHVVMFGGNAPQTLRGTWLWSGEDWTVRHQQNPPSPRREFGMVYDEARGDVVLFGGHDQSKPITFNDTWIHDYPKCAASNTSIGVGCKGSNGAPSLVATRLAYLGEPFTVELRNVASHRLPPLWVFSASAASQPIPLPWLDPACKLYLDSPLVFSGLPSPVGGVSRITVTIPAQASLCGTTTVHQGYAGDSGARGGATVSNAVKTVVGAR